MVTDKDQSAVNYIIHADYDDCDIFNFVQCIWSVSIFISIDVEENVLRHRKIQEYVDRNNHDIVVEKISIYGKFANNFLLLFCIVPRS